MNEKGRPLCARPVQLEAGVAVGVGLEVGVAELDCLKAGLRGRARGGESDQTRDEGDSLKED